MRPIVWRPAFAFLVALLLSGCMPPCLVGAGEETAYSRVPVNSRVHLERRLTVAPGQARVWLRGDATSTGSSSEVPICGFEIDRVDPENPQFIAPGEFRIYRVQPLWSEFAQAPRHPAYRLAGLGGGSDGGGTPMVYEGYHLWLENPQQPHVWRLTCLGVFADMWEAKPPTVAEIRQSLGRLARLELAAESVSSCR